MLFINMKFRVITQYSDEACKNVSYILGREGIRIYDVREAELVNDSDNSKVEDVYVLCCKADRSKFREIKEKYEFDEIIYEGFKTLI